MYNAMVGCSRRTPTRKLLTRFYSVVWPGRHSKIIVARYDMASATRFHTVTGVRHVVSNMETNLVPSSQMNSGFDPILGKRDGCQCCGVIHGKCLLYPWVTCDGEGCGYLMYGAWSNEDSSFSPISEPHRAVLVWATDSSFQILLLVKSMPKNLEPRTSAIPVYCGSE